MRGQKDGNMRATIESELDQLLSEGLPAAVERRRTAFDQQGGGNGLILFGQGGLAEEH